MTLGKKLKVLLRDRRATVVAEKAGIHPNTLNNYVNHGNIPPSNVALLLARILCVDASWLIDETQDFPAIPCKNPMLPTLPITSQTVAA